MNIKLSIIQLRSHISLQLLALFFPDLIQSLTFTGDIGNYYYGQGHPMKPHRIRMTHNLLLNYGLYRKMEIYRPHKATQEEITKFHSDDYIRFLRSIRPDNMSEYNKQMQRFNVGEVRMNTCLFKT